MVLVGSDSNKLSFGENEASAFLHLHINDWTFIPTPSLDEPHPGLELVHGVEDQLPAVVALVVGDLDLLEANDLLLQLICCEGTIRMTVETVGWSWICLSRNYLKF